MANILKTDFSKTERTVLAILLVGFIIFAGIIFSFFFMNEPEVDFKQRKADQICQALQEHHAVNLEVTEEDGVSVSFDCVRE